MPLSKKRKVEHQHQEHQERQKHQEHQEHQKHQKHQKHQEHQEHQEQQVCGQVCNQQVRGQQVRVQEIPVPTKSIEKLISQNFKILLKLDTLISAQQLIDDRLKKSKVPQMKVQVKK